MASHGLVQLAIWLESQRKVIGVFASSIEHISLVDFDNLAVNSIPNCALGGVCPSTPIVADSVRDDWSTTVAQGPLSSLKYGCNNAPLRFKFKLEAVVLARFYFEPACTQEVPTAVDRAVKSKSEGREFGGKGKP